MSQRWLHCWAEHASAATDFDPERLTQDDLVALAYRGVDWSRANSDRYVRRTRLVVPIGTAVVGSIEQERVYRKDAAFNATVGATGLLVSSADP